MQTNHRHYRHHNCSGYTLLLTLVFGLLLLSTTTVSVFLLRTQGRIASGMQHKTNTLNSADGALEIGRTAVQQWLATAQSGGVAADFSPLLAAAAANDNYLKIDSTVYHGLTLANGMTYDIRLFNNEDDPTTDNDSDRKIKLVATARANDGARSTVESYLQAPDSCWHGGADGFCLPRLPASVILCSKNENDDAVAYKKQYLWMQAHSELSGINHSQLPPEDCQKQIVGKPLWQKMQACKSEAYGTLDYFGLIHGPVKKYKPIIAKSSALAGYPEAVGSPKEDGCVDLRQLADSLYNLETDNPKFQRISDKVYIPNSIDLGDRAHPKVTVIDSKKGATFLKPKFKGAGILIIHGNPNTKAFPTTTANLMYGGYFEGIIFVYGKSYFTAARYGHSTVHYGATVVLSGEPTEAEDNDGEADSDPDETAPDETGESDDDYYSDSVPTTEVKNQANVRLKTHAAVYFSTAALDIAAKAASGLIAAPPKGAPSANVVNISWREIP